MRSALRASSIALSVGLGILLGGCGGGTASTSSTTAPAPSGQGQKGGEASVEEFGSEASGPDREEILAVFTGYLNAIAAKDYGKACSDLATPVQEGLQQFDAKAPKGTDCTAILPGLLAPTAGAVAREQVNGKITKVRVQGDRAFVVFHAPGAKLYQLTMIREGGEWKATTVGAGVLVPEL
jgi:hypothetical protein